MSIINDILDFSKIEAGQLELKERIFRLDEMFDRVLDIFIHQATNKGIELLVDIDREIPRMLLGDALRLQQILTNLISNSLKFTASGGSILISAKPHSCKVDAAAAERIELDFSVKDTGTGISPGILPTIFDPFTQGDSSSTKKYEGTGLGLSICKKFVSMMNGTIGVQSKEGEGSTFFFTVQLGLAGTASCERPSLPPDILGLHVLVVDDLADSRLIMASILESLGFEVETCSSGECALRRLSQAGQTENCCDLVLMDWKMPNLNGLETSRIIRQDLGLNVPIIMMTAFGTEGLREEAERTGINGFLTKPIFQSTLFDAIMDAFGKHGKRSSEHRHSFITRSSMYLHQLSGYKVLLAEDNITNQQVAIAILSTAQLEVVLARNGEEAVNALKNEDFDAVLMDIQMPKMNGYEATRKIRELTNGKNLPIIAMTAHAMKGDEEKCLEAGMDAYLSKPINQERLFSTLSRLLRNTPKRRQYIQTDKALDEAGNKPETTPSKVDADAQISMSDIPGLDVQGALELTGLDMDTYRTIVLAFCADNTNTPAEVAQALADRNYKKLRQLSHALKGSGSNIGANSLHDAALEVETASRLGEKGEQVPEEFETLARHMVEELEKILQLNPHDSTPAADLDVPPKSPVGNAELPTPLKEGLRTAIEHADPESIDNYRKLCRREFSANGANPPSDFHVLERQLDRYDYEQALETLKQL